MASPLLRRQPLTGLLRYETPSPQTPVEAIVAGLKDQMQSLPGIMVSDATRSSSSRYFGGGLMPQIFLRPPGSANDPAARQAILNAPPMAGRRRFG